MQDASAWAERLGPPGWVVTAALAAGAVLAALLVHAVALAAVRRAAARTHTVTDDVLVARFGRPTRWLAAAVAAGTVLSTAALGPEGARLVRRIAGLVAPALFGWLAIAAVAAANDLVVARSDVSVEDNLRARRRRTRAGLLARIGYFAILLVTACLMLMSVPAIRSVGVTLIASAGLAALAVGAAAQPALKNLVAGLQMAFTEPIRLDDVVVLNGEWGRIEDIRLTYVVVKLWDERRLVVPVSKFLEEPFQNWTRETAQVTGSVTLHLDPSADVGRLRAKLEEVVRANPRWDGRFFNMQVVETTPDAVQVRALVTARDAGLAFDLRCDVREALLAFVRDEMPDAFVRRRDEVRVAAAA